MPCSESRLGVPPLGGKAFEMTKQHLICDRSRLKAGLQTA